MYLESFFPHYVPEQVPVWLLFLFLTTNCQAALVYWFVVMFGLFIKEDLKAYS